MDPQTDLDLDRPPLIEGLGLKYPVLDLGRVPEELWVSTLERFHPNTYSYSCNSVDFARIGQAMAACAQAELNVAGDRQAAAPHQADLPRKQYKSLGLSRQRTYQQRISQIH